MNDEKWLVVGTDARMKVLAKRLSDGKRTVYYKNVNEWDEELNKTVLAFHPHFVVLPIHPLEIKVQNVLGLSDAIIFSGKLNDSWEKILNDNELHFYLEDESFIWYNAVLTAEAFVSTFYNTKRAIQGKKFIITGFGRVAKMTANILRNIGAEVSIAVRSNVQLNEAKAFRYEAIDLKDVGDIEGDFFINTIPAKWLDEQFNKKISMPIYDLASYPGCLQDGVHRNNYEFLPALPGKFFPEDAGNVLYESIVGQLRRRNSC
ncbi:MULTISPECIES: dipicolinate synthase subunit A [Lysinibacillus]|uniref:Dipicolinate synthase subunit A n=1 Tax=Lysinibacillus antri TaxID=2498145 RepID=A0A432LET5_9BACI|nr:MULTISPECIES: dipicolinate synthase subunit A [Lysinibacillus]RUL55754.1 dipicolinate synthase subunit A [Lysinibacillus antri]TSI11358.1 dipicolinate synthase subunit A [Lysinibacillus sp. BW-2-10]